MPYNLETLLLIPQITLDNFLRRNNVIMIIFLEQGKMKTEKKLINISLQSISALKVPIFNGCIYQSHVSNDELLSFFISC